MPDYTELHRQEEDAGRSNIAKWLGHSACRDLGGDKWKGLAEMSVAPVADLLVDQIAVTAFALESVDCLTLMPDGRLNLQFTECIDAKDRPRVEACMRRFAAVLRDVAALLAARDVRLDPAAPMNLVAIAQLLMCEFDTSEPTADIVKRLNVFGPTSISGDLRSTHKTHHSTHASETNLMAIRNQLEKMVGVPTFGGAYAGGQPRNQVYLVELRRQCLHELLVEQVPMTPATLARGYKGWYGVGGRLHAMMDDQSVLSCLPRDGLPDTYSERTFRDDLAVLKSTLDK